MLNPDASTVARVITSLRFPELVRVTARVLLAPTGTFPKARLLELKLSGANPAALVEKQKTASNTNTKSAGWALRAELCIFEGFSRLRG
jgi:hypothetical protein